MKDYLIRGMAMEGKIRAFAVQTTQLMEELRQRHDTWPVATQALGRTVSVAAMMGAMLKGEEKLTIHIKGEGPLGQIVVDANASGEIRGYVNEPHVDIPLNEEGGLDVGAAIGNGYLYVTKDLGLKEPYRGSVPLLSGEIGEDFTVYFAQSEQTPSAVAVGVLIDIDASVLSSGGFIIQLLPGVPENEIKLLEFKLSKIKSFSEMLNKGWSLEEVMSSLLDDFEVLETLPVTFKCSCSRDRVGQMLVSLGREELVRLNEEDEQLEVVCHFCNEKYQFTKEEVSDLIQGM